MYFVWYKLRNDQSAHWERMPYSGRTRPEAEGLLDYYEGKWGNLYHYQVLPSTLVPKGWAIA